MTTKARKRQDHRCGRCVNKCNTVLPQVDRELIFHNYWKMGGGSHIQKYFIPGHVTAK